MRWWLPAAIILTLAFAARADSPQPIYGGLNNNAGQGSIGNIGLLQIGITSSGGGGGCANTMTMIFSNSCNIIGGVSTGML